MKTKPASTNNESPTTRAASKGQLPVSKFLPLMKLMPFIGLAGLVATFAVPMRCLAGPVSIGPGFTLLVNPGTTGNINSVLPSAMEGDEVLQFGGVTCGGPYAVDTYAANSDDVGFIGWYDNCTANPGLIFWAFGSSCWYFTPYASGETLNFAGDPPQPVPTARPGYNFLGNVTANVLGYNDIALGQFDPSTCPAYLYNRTTGNLDAYWYGVGTPLSVNPDEGVIFVKPAVLTINPSTTNSSQLIVTWEGGGQLQTTSVLNGGSWTTLPNAASPFIVDKYQTNALFLRVILPPPPLP